MIFSMFSYSKNINKYILHLFIQQIRIVYQEPGSMPSCGFSLQQLLLSEGLADALSKIHLTLAIHSSQRDLGSLKKRECPSLS